VIMAAGFVEDERGEGKARQAELDEILRDSDLVVCGPNSEGYFNLSSGIALSLSQSVSADFLRKAATWVPQDEPDLARALAGGVAIVAQSGSLGFSIFSRGAVAGIGFSHVVSLGNEIDIDVLDCTEYLLSRPEVKVIGMYVEGLRRPERLAAIAEAARAAGKALVIGKAGSSKAGRVAALSHTGHLAGESMVYDAVFRRLGIIQVYDQEELLDVCAALATNDPIKGHGVAVVSWSGGSAVWTSDALERAGFTLPEVDLVRQGALAKLLPPFASIRNPVDITGASKVGLAKIVR
jgi:acyl-CoA synthetase (NDP forming)